MIASSVRGDAIKSVNDHANSVLSRKMAKPRPKRSNQTLSLPLPFLTFDESLSPLGPSNVLLVSEVKAFTVWTEADSICQRESLEVCLASS